jgi:hypothetical protein
MTDTPTPGEVAYAAYQRVHTEDGIRDGYVTLRCPFESMPEVTQRAWEAAAQAVLATSPVCLLCGTRLLLQRCNRFGDPHWIGCLTCGGIGYVAECPGAHTEALIAAYAAREKEQNAP